MRKRSIHITIIINNQKQKKTQLMLVSIFRKFNVTENAENGI